MIISLAKEAKTTPMVYIICDKKREIKEDNEGRGTLRKKLKSGRDSEKFRNVLGKKGFLDKHNVSWY